MDRTPSVESSYFTFSRGYVVGKMAENTCDDEQIIGVGCGKFTYEVGVGYEGKGSKTSNKSEMYPLYLFLFTVRRSFPKEMI